jgi:hypothetical protein
MLQKKASLHSPEIDAEALLRPSFVMEHSLCQSVVLFPGKINPRLGGNTRHFLIGDGDLSSRLTIFDFRAPGFNRELADPKA